MKNSENRGGARKGAGRKKLEIEKVQFSMKIEKKVLDDVSLKFTSKERNKKIIEFLKGLA